jgi:phosphoglycerate dehydrogenase-like enzyme
MTSTTSPVRAAGVHMALPSRLRERLLSFVDPEAVIEWYSDIDTAVSASLDAELVYLTLPVVRTVEIRQLVTGAQRLRWMHLNMVGVDTLDLSPLRDRGILLTNGAGLAAVPVAEHVLMCVLAASRSLPALVLAQSRHEWAKDAARGDDLFGRTALVLGWGNLGRAVAERLRAMGVQVTGARRQPGDDPSVVSGEGWRELLPQADFVIVCLPLTARTNNLIGPDELGLMKKSAWLINVARGGVVNELALAAALGSGVIAGAAVDVFEVEPLPSEHPFWTAPNLILTPHVAWKSNLADHRAVALFESRLRQYLVEPASLPLVDLDEGY